MESEEAEWERFILWIILDPYYLVDSKSPFNFNFKSLILCYPTATASPGETLKGNGSVSSKDSVVFFEVDPEKRAEVSEQFE